MGASQSGPAAGRPGPPTPPGSALRLLQHRGSSNVGSYIFSAGCFVAVLMTTTITTARILDFIARASRRAKCHISSSRYCRAPAREHISMADMVRAVVQTGPRQMELREFPRPVIGPDDGALLRVEACGICGSDVEQYKGAMGTRGLPMIPGHEPLGIIEEIAPATAARWGVSAGDRVAVEILIPCR